MSDIEAGRCHPASVRPRERRSCILHNESSSILDSSTPTRFMHYTSVKIQKVKEGEIVIVIA